MKRLFLLAVLLLSLLVLSPVSAHEHHDIIAYNIWARPALEGEVSAVFLQIENAGGHDIALVSASSDAAAAVEIHETTMEGDVMNMSPVESLPIPVGETVSLERGGYHIMLIGLTRDLVAGEALAVTLEFDMLDDESEPIIMTVGALVAEEAPTSGDLVISDVWTRPGLSEGNGAVYMRIENRGETAASLIGVFTEAAEVSEIHETVMEDDVMNMSPITVLEIPAGEDSLVALEPGGYHIMLINTARDLAIGEAIVVRLDFEDGNAVTVAAAVRDNPSHSDMEHGEHGDEEHGEEGEHGEGEHGEGEHGGN